MLRMLSDLKLMLRRLCLSRAEPVLYIGGSDTLPQPLTAAEEHDLLLRFEAADPETAAVLRNQLIERNLRLVVFIAKKFENTGIGLEDLISIGSIGLIKAINTFRTDRQIKLATYASRCIENEILMYIRKNSSQRYEMSIDEPLHVDWDGNELLLSDILGSDDDQISTDIEKAEDRKLIFDALSHLTERERLIIRLRFGLPASPDPETGSNSEKIPSGAPQKIRPETPAAEQMQELKEKTQKEVADLLGISQSYISRLEKKIIRILKSEIAGKL